MTAAGDTGTQARDFPAGGCAVVFGGTGGIGAATAGLLAQRGCDVVLTYRSRAHEAEELATSIRALGQQATAIECDVTDSTSTASVVDSALAAHGRIHTVVSASGLSFRFGPLAEFSQTEFSDVVTADVLGFLNIARSSVPALRDGGGGSITAVTASAVERTVPADAMSAVPKAAVAMMVRMLAAEEGPNGIRTNAVGPGIVDGGLVDSMREDPALKDMLANAVHTIPLRRLGLTADIAEAIVFLASAKASYITGQRLMVDGGHTA